MSTSADVGGDDVSPDSAAHSVGGGGGEKKGVPEVEERSGDCQETHSPLLSTGCPGRERGGGGGERDRSNLPQEKELAPVISSLPQLQQHHSALALSLDATRHELPTSGLIPTTESMLIPLPPLSLSLLPFLYRH